MKYKFIQITKDSTIAQMQANTEENIKTIKLLSEEVSRLKLASYQTETSSKEEITPAVISEEIIEEELDNDASLLEEINYYYSKIVGESTTISDLEDKNSLKNMLPSLKNPNYQNIIYGICALLLKEINEIKSFIETEKQDLKKEELQEFKDEIIFKQKTILEVNKANIENLEDAELEETEVLNNIVFLETSSGNIYAQHDLNPNAIPSEYYAGFYELINSIQEGTFKNVKMLTSNNSGTAGVSEVKGFKRRVIFDRVGYNTYVIIGIFTKKSDMDKGYIDQLKNRIAIYRKRRESIVEKAKSNEYIQEQQEILNQIYEIIKPKEEVKEVQKGLK